MHRFNGITSIEIVISVAIIAILAALSLPHYFTYLENNRLRASAEHVYQELIHARSLAIKQGAMAQLVFTTGANWCVGVTSASSCTCSTSGSCNQGVVSGSDFPSTNLSATGLSSGIEFDGPRGLANGAGSLVFSAGSKSVSIVLNRMGHARLCSSTIPGLASC